MERKNCNQFLIEISFNPIQAVDGEKTVDAPPCIFLSPSQYKQQQQQQQKKKKIHAFQSLFLLMFTQMREATSRLSQEFADEDCKLAQKANQRPFFKQDTDSRTFPSRASTRRFRLTCAVLPTFSCQERVSGWTRMSSASHSTTTSSAPTTTLKDRLCSTSGTPVWRKPCTL